MREEISKKELWFATWPEQPLEKFIPLEKLYKNIRPLTRAEPQRKLSCKPSPPTQKQQVEVASDYLTLLMTLHYTFPNLPSVLKQKRRRRFAVLQHSKKAFIVIAEHILLKGTSTLKKILVFIQNTKWVENFIYHISVDHCKLN